MNEPIKVGDLVVAVKGCANCDCRILGVPFTVSTISLARDLRCGFIIRLGSHRCATGLAHYEIPLTWLKRIPPLSELDDVKREEEITA